MVQFAVGTTDFSFLQSFKQTPGPTQPPIQWIIGALLLNVSRQGIKLTTHLHLVLRVIMTGEIPPLPHKPARYAQGRLYFRWQWPGSEGQDVNIYTVISLAISDVDHSFYNKTRLNRFKTAISNMKLTHKILPNVDTSNVLTDTVIFISEDTVLFSSPAAPPASFRMTSKVSVRYITSSLFNWGVTSSPSAVIRNSIFIVKNLTSWGTSGFLHAWSRTTMPSSEWFLVLSIWAHGLLKIMLQRHFIASDITKKRNEVIQKLNIHNTQFFYYKYKQ